MMSNKPWRLYLVNALAFILIARYSPWHSLIDRNYSRLFNSLTLLVIIELYIVIRYYHQLKYPVLKTILIFILSVFIAIQFNLSDLRNHLPAGYTVDLLRPFIELSLGMTLAWLLKVLKKPQPSA